MGYLGKKEREALSKDIFGDPDRLLYPIQSDEDINIAAQTIDLLPNSDVIKSNISKIAQEKGFTLPEGWNVPISEAAPIEFALFEDSSETVNDADLGPVVIKTGKIFEASDYPDKKYQMTPEELLLAAKTFEPVGLNDSHNSASLLKGRWGKLRSVKVADNGWDLHGEVAVPVWLDTAMKGEPIKVSAEWNRDTKKLEKLAYVNNPRVPDAAIYAAFTQSEIANDSEMTDIMTKWFEQRLGTKTPDQPSGKPATPPSVDATKGKNIMGYLADFKNDILKALKKVPDDDPNLIELNDDEEPEVEKPEDKKIVLSASKKKKEADIEEEPKVEAKKEVTIVMSEEDRKEMDNLRNQIAALEQDKLEAAAKKFADDMVTAEFAYPAERSVMIASYMQAANDDKASAVTIKFTAGSDQVEGTRVDALKALYATRRPHNLTKETLAAFGAGVLATDKVDTSDEDARKAAEEFADQFNRRLQKQAAAKR